MAHATYLGRDFSVSENSDVHAAVMIHPERHEAADVAKLLLGLADDPSQVQSTMDGAHGTAFVVPAWLADLYAEATAIPLDDGDDEAEEVDDTTEEPVEEEAPVPKRRGRPPGSKNKTTDSADQE